jgi:hypothetical protein
MNGNGGFQPGTWEQLPSNCTRDYTVVYQRCIAYGTRLISACLAWDSQVMQTCAQWSFQKARQCISWASQQSSQCCTWWPCSWGCAALYVVVSFFCVVFAIVVTAVCAVFAFIVFIVCIIPAILIWILCIAWSLIEIIFCMSNANGGTAFLLTDGTIMMQECEQFAASVFTGSAWPTNRWWKLTPDEFGNYTTGKWTRLRGSSKGRLDFASGVLADGRVLVCGGEWTDTDVNISIGGQVIPADDNTCEIYDPVANIWSTVPTPTQPGSSAPWDRIGDAPCAVLPDGTFLMGSIDSSNVTKLDPSTLAWTAMSMRPSGNSEEESWVLMPDGTIAAPSCFMSPTTWVYDITSDNWIPGDPLIKNVVNIVLEIGPGLLRYDGTAIFLGANQFTAIFSPTAEPQWKNGPDMPMQDGSNVGVVDGPAALLPNGNILFAAGPINAAGDFLKPCYFFEFDESTFNRTVDPPNRGTETFMTRMLLLPNGDVLWCRTDSSSFYAYHPQASPPDSARPVIQQCPTALQPGTAVDISGLQFNGLSQAVAFGDDSTAATNYPLVRVTNTQTGHVRYCRTFNHRTVNDSGNTTPSMGVATGSAVITTSVQIPADLEQGKSSLEVVANGIASVPFAVTVSTTSPPTVATPVVQPPTGFFVQPVNVSMSDATPGATIFYTTDGTQPTTASNPYTGPFTVQFTGAAGTTVMAKAVLAGWNDSAVATVVYTWGQ